MPTISVINSSIICITYLIEIELYGYLYQYIVNIKAWVYWLLPNFLLLDICFVHMMR